jgi:hypothetical protein
MKRACILARFIHSQGLSNLFQTPVCNDLFHHQVGLRMQVRPSTCRKPAPKELQNLQRSQQAVDLGTGAGSQWLQGAARRAAVKAAAVRGIFQTGDPEAGGYGGIDIGQ